MPKQTFGGLHGAFHAGRILAAINTQIGCTGAGCNYGAMTFETFVFRDPAPAEYPTDWCGMPAGTCTQGHKNCVPCARVTGTGQLVAHLSARALAMATMHPVNVSGGPAMQAPILGSKQPCLQAAAFRGSAEGAAAADADATVFAVLNICNTTIAATLGAASAGAAVIYDLADPGGKAPLPAEPDSFPWPAPLTARRAGATAAGVYTAPPLSFAVVETSGVARF